MTKEQKERTPVESAMSAVYEAQRNIIAIDKFILAMDGKAVHEHGSTTLRLTGFGMEFDGYNNQILKKELFDSTEQQRLLMMFKEIVQVSRKRTEDNYEIALKRLESAIKEELFAKHPTTCSCSH